ncbi:MAG: Kelch repeat-containing protein [Planctomycetota bacterium]|jgi:hypothetical protein
MEYGMRMRVKWLMGAGMALAAVILASSVGAKPSASWSQKLPAVTPPGRAYHAMAYDSRRAATVLFGGRTPGAIGDTWEWDGTNWNQCLTTPSPAGRWSHAMAFDVKRRRTVLFGGLQGGGAAGLSDTWEWEGANWTRQFPAASPPARWQHAMVYDSFREIVVMFGGWNSGGYLADTWEWDGANWQKRTPIVSPPARQHHSMAYDAHRKRTVMFGGYGGTNLSDTWEWDGTNWTNVTPTISPAGRLAHGMAYYAFRKRVVMYGGATLYGATSFSDTWEWDGTSWVQQQPSTMPAARWGHAIVYDSRRKDVTIFGGENPFANYFPETWVYGRAK